MKFVKNVCTIVGVICIARLTFDALADIARKTAERVVQEHLDKHVDSLDQFFNK